MTESTPTAWERASRPIVASVPGEERVGAGRAAMSRAPEPAAHAGGRALTRAEATGLTVQRVSRRAVVADFTLVMIAAPILGVIAAVAMLGLGREFAERIARPPTILATPAAPAPTPRPAAPARDEADATPEAPQPRTAVAAAVETRRWSGKPFSGLETASAEARSRPLAAGAGFAEQTVAHGGFGPASPPARADVLGREADSTPAAPTVIWKAGARRTAAGAVAMTAAMTADSALDAVAAGESDAAPTAPSAGAAPPSPAPGGLNDMRSTAAIDRAAAAPYDPSASAAIAAVEAPIGATLVAGVADMDSAAAVDRAPAAPYDPETADAASTGAGAQDTAAPGGPETLGAAMMVDRGRADSGVVAFGLEPEPDGYGVAPDRSERPSRPRWGLGVAPEAAEPPSPRRVRSVQNARSAQSVRSARRPRTRAPRAAEAPSPRPEPNADPDDLLRRMRDGSL